MYANNFMRSAISLAVLRAQYQSRTFPLLENGRVDPAIKDINSMELQYYGKINTEGIPIYLDESNLTTIGQSKEFIDDKPHRTLPFIKRMHAAMKNNIQMKMTLGNLLPTQQAISTMEPVMTFVSPISEYNTYIKNLFRDFNLQISDNDKNNITHFESYVKQIVNYFSTFDKGTPITFSGWTTSKENSLHTTGLTISLMDNDYHDDEQNTDFVNNLMFGYYKKLAMNRGFCLVKQAPWILIADLNSPAIKQFYDDTTTNGANIINYNYNLCYNIDIEFLYNNLIEFYNDFVLFNPQIRTTEVLCTNKTKIHKQDRKFISDLDMTYRNPRKYITMYCRFRNQEEGFPLSEYNINQMIKKSKTFLDISGAMGYINGIFAAELFKKPFGLGDMVRRFDARIKSDKGIGPTGQQSQQAIGSGTSMLGGGSGGGMSGGGSSGGY